MFDKALLDAYRETLFVAEIPSGRLIIRVGSTSQQLDELMELAGRDAWAFITASNPASLPLAAEVNRARNAELQKRIETLSLLSYPGFGHSSDGDWPPEESLLVLGVDRALAVQIGREFGQNAIVVGVRGCPAQLVGCVEGSGDAL